MKCSWSYNSSFRRKKAAIFALPHCTGGVPGTRSVAAGDPLTRPRLAGSGRSLSHNNRPNHPMDMLNTFCGVDAIAAALSA